MVALPGASAGITALIASGLAPPTSYFLWLPVKRDSRLTFQGKSILS